MLKICLAVLENGQVDQILVKLPIGETTLDDVRDALDTAIADYYGDLENEEGNDGED